MKFRLEAVFPGNTIFRLKAKLQTCFVIPLLVLEFY